LPVDTDKLEAELVTHGNHLEELLKRVSQQAVDIKELREELDELEDDIRSEQAEETARA